MPNNMVVGGGGRRGGSSSGGGGGLEGSGSTFGLFALGRTMRAVAAFAAFHALRSHRMPVFFYLLIATAGAALSVLAVQKPWSGKAVSTNKIVKLFVGGLILATTLTLWTLGLRECGPLRTLIMDGAELPLFYIFSVCMKKEKPDSRRTKGACLIILAYILLMFDATERAPTGRGILRRTKMGREVDERIIRLRNGTMAKLFEFRDHHLPNGTLSVKNLKSFAQKRADAAMHSKGGSNKLRSGQRAGRRRLLSTETADRVARRDDDGRRELAREEYGDDRRGRDAPGRRGGGDEYGDRRREYADRYGGGRGGGQGEAERGAGGASSSSREYDERGRGEARRDDRRDDPRDEPPRDAASRGGRGGARDDDFRSDGRRADDPSDLRNVDRDYRGRGDPAEAVRATREKFADEWGRRDGADAAAAAPPPPPVRGDDLRARGRDPDAPLDEGGATGRRKFDEGEGGRRRFDDGEGGGRVPPPPPPRRRGSDVESGGDGAGDRSRNANPDGLPEGADGGAEWRRAGRPEQVDEPGKDEPAEEFADDMPNMEDMYGGYEDVTDMYEDYDLEYDDYDEEEDDAEDLDAPEFQGKDKVFKSMTLESLAAHRKPHRVIGVLLVLSSSAVTQASRGYTRHIAAEIGGAKRFFSLSLATAWGSLLIPGVVSYFVTPGVHVSVFSTVQFLFVGFLWLVFPYYIRSMVSSKLTSKILLQGGVVVPFLFAALMSMLFGYGQSSGGVTILVLVAFILSAIGFKLVVADLRHGAELPLDTRAPSSSD